MTSWPQTLTPGSAEAAAHATELTVVEPLGAALLDRTEAFLARFIAFPSEACQVATTLWAAHTHVVDAFESTPRLAILSPEPGSGKSRVLEVLELLCPRPLHAVNISPSALFRSISDEAGPPTILYDEVDTLFGPKAKDNEDVRGLLNAGHRRGAVTLRCVVRGKTIDVEEFPAFCAVALAGLGDLPDTLMTRSIVVRMRRRAPGEKVEPFRHRLHAPEAEPLRLCLEEWTRGARDDLEDAWPDMPEGIVDRNADVWEPLLALADVAGGTWPERARVAAVSLVTQAGERPQTLGIQLLADLRNLFSTPLNYVEVGLHSAVTTPPAVTDPVTPDALSTQQILEGLTAMEESPWGDLRGKPLDSRGLARRLKQYDVNPAVIRVGASTVRGYRRTDLHDAWSRYLPPPSEGCVTSETSATPEVADPDVPGWYAEELS